MQAHQGENIFMASLMPIFLSLWLLIWSLVDGADSPEVAAVYEVPVMRKIPRAWLGWALQDPLGLCVQSWLKKVVLVHSVVVGQLQSISVLWLTLVFCLQFLIPPLEAWWMTQSQNSLSSSYLTKCLLWEKKGRWLQATLMRLLRVDKSGA